MKRAALYIMGLSFFVIRGGLVSGQTTETGVLVRQPAFPSTLQLSPAPSGAGGYSIDNIIKAGFSDFWVYSLKGNGMKEALDLAQSRGMAIDYMTAGFEGFDRAHAPATSVYAPQYAVEVRRRVDSGLAPLKDIKRVYAVFPFQDEPFHAGPSSFDYSGYARAEFKKRYGYAMPDSPAAVKDDPRKWLDLLNFQSNTFRDGWIKLYHAVKDFDARPKVVMTHDSHNSFGAGVRSNSRLAMDDVFHWGGDFADVLAYDIYPYMTFDYRYGELGRLPRPRISQMHYTISQLRNVATAYGKELGFWVGTYSEKWFQRFRGPERKSQYWSERELSYTAIAQGADFLISPSNYNTANLPLDTLHWEDYSKAMRLVQQEGPGLLKAPKVKARACFLFPRTQYLLLQEEYYNVGLSFELFLRAFGELDILHEEQITDDRLNGYKVLVLADVKLLPAEVARHIASFVRKGGVVIADCVPGMDAGKQPLDVMARLFGVRQAATGRIAREGQWVPFAALPPKMSFPPPAGYKEAAKEDLLNGRAFDEKFNFRVISPRDIVTAKGRAGCRVVLKMGSGWPGLLRREWGKGRVYLFGFCIQDTYFGTWKNDDPAGRQALRSLIGDVFRDARIGPHVHSSNPDIEASLRAGDKEGYLFIINHEAVDPATSVRLAGLGFPVGHIVDVERGEPVAFTRKEGAIEFNINAAFGGTRLLKLLP